MWQGLEVGGRRILTIGAAGSLIGTISALLDAGARVRVVADPPGPAIQDLADRGRIELINEVGDDVLTEVALVITGANPRPFDSVLQTATQRGLLIYPLQPRNSVRLEMVEASAADDRGHRLGEVVLVGGGPGDPGLLTVAGLEEIKDADVIATDRLAPLAALEHARPDAEIIDVGKIPRGPGAEQRSIEGLLIEHAKSGRKVVRLKGGDNFVFGRGGEEWQACAAAGVPVRIIPGVTSAIAAPAAAGIPVTHHSLSQGFTVVTGHVRPDDPRSSIDWAALARTGTGLVIMMGMAQLPAIAETLINNGLSADTPAAVIEDGTLASMKVVRAPLAEIAGRTRAEGLGAPATIVIGAVAAFDPGADL